MKLIANHSVKSPLQLQNHSDLLKAGRELYNAPEIEIIQLDNEISLVLESTPPEGPGEGALTKNDTPNNPFNDNFFV